MQQVLEILLIFTAFISLVPVIRIARNRKDSKYICLKVLIFSMFVWTVLIVMERISTSTFLIYYSGILGYPLRFLFSILMLCTIFQYIEKKLPKGVMLLLGLILLFDVIVALTNSHTLLFLELSRSQLTSFNDLYTAAKGPLFIYHLIISYVIVLIAIISLISFLTKQTVVRQYKEITRMLVISGLVVLFFNAAQLFLIETNVNLTYISLVFVTYILYDIIYRKDMIFNLRTSGRSEILANMREMYILTDMNKRIVEISDSLIEKYELSSEEVIGQPFDVVAAMIEDKVTFYSEYTMEGNISENKDYYHLREKEFNLKGMNESGHMILLYDETQVYNLLRELNKLSNFDTMTGLNNRNYIENVLDNLKETKDVAVFSLDINGLKINNDYLGHERGDYLLKTLAHKLKVVFSDIPNKEIARIGGDEFLVIIYDTKKSVLEQKKNALLEACDSDEAEKQISVSIGVAYDEIGDLSIYNLIQQADAEMYEMKAQISKAYQDKMLDYIKRQDKFIR
ncbi:MAG: diguanylate cyclase [Candidatus Izimaplasma sp.]|nr:diguanylate cyclase [Candidatus Izimaplasma bacterium]